MTRVTIHGQVNGRLPQRRLVTVIPFKVYHFSRNENLMIKTRTKQNSLYLVFGVTAELRFSLCNKTN